MTRRLRAGPTVRAWVLGLLIVAAALSSSSSSAQGDEVPANGRAWELITPGEPVSSLVSAAVPPEDDDTRILYSSVGPMPGVPSGPLFGGISLTARSDVGWASTPVGFPYSFFSLDDLQALGPVVLADHSDDLGTTLWISIVPLMPGAPPEGTMALYLRSPDGTPTLVTPTGGDFPMAFEDFVDLSGDGKQVILASSEHLLPGDAGRTSGKSLYRWTNAGLELVDVDSNGSLLSACGSTAAHPNGVSATGDRVFFVNPAQASCPGTRRAYLREGGGTTIEISASQCTRADCGAPQHVAFAGATPSGDHAFLTTTQQLTSDDVDTTRDLYRYDVAGGMLALLTVAQPEASGVVREELVQPSIDGSRIYFNADGRLVTGKGPTSGAAIYLAGPNGLRFVLAKAGPDRIQPTDDGQSALLSTRAALVEGDTDEREDVYLYDAADATFTWLSTGPSGGNGSVDAHIRTPLEVDNSFIGDMSPRVGRAITRDGRDAFFTTAESLVPADANNATDVYEWTAGRLGLVSSGTAKTGVSFGGVSADGRTALFETSATLTSGDLDGGQRDLYVARVGGGFADDSATPAQQGTTFVPGRIQRSIPVSASFLGRRPGGPIRLLGIRQNEGTRGTPSIDLLLRVPAPGRIYALAWTRNTAHKRIVLARGSGGAVRPGRVEISLPLTAAGRRILARQHRVEGSIAVRQGGDRLVLPLRLRQES